MDREKMENWVGVYVKDILDREFTLTEALILVNKVYSEINKRFKAWVKEHP